MTFKDALHILSSNVILKTVVPDWAKNLTKHTQKGYMAFTEMKVCYSNSPGIGAHVLIVLYAPSSSTWWKWWKLARMGRK